MLIVLYLMLFDCIKIALRFNPDFVNFSQYNFYIHSFKAMLTQQILDILQDNRRSDMTIQPLIQIYDFESYSQSKKQEMKILGDVACILLQVLHLYRPIESKFHLFRWNFNILRDLIFQECDELPIRKSTKYLAKNYFDRFVAYCNRSNIKIQINKMLLVVFNAISMAIKFNQNSQISDAYSNIYFYQKSGQKFNIDEFNCGEIQLFSILGLKLKITTPYDYLQPIKQIFPKNQKKISYLEGLIDLSLTLEQLTSISAQQRFFGCFLLCLESSWSAYIESVICAITGKFQQAQKIALIIKQAYAQILGFSQ